MFKGKNQLRKVFEGQGARNKGQKGDSDGGNRFTQTPVHLTHWCVPYSPASQLLQMQHPTLLCAVTIHSMLHISTTDGY